MLCLRQALSPGGHPCAGLRRLCTPRCHGAAQARRAEPALDRSLPRWAGAALHLSVPLYPDRIDRAIQGLYRRSSERFTQSSTGRGGAVVGCRQTPDTAATLGTRGGTQPTAYGVPLV